MLSLQIESAGESVEAFHSLHPRPVRDADGHVPPILGQTQLSHQSRRRAFRRTDPRLLDALLKPKMCPTSEARKPIMMIVGRFRHHFSELHVYSSKWITFGCADIQALTFQERSRYDLL